MRRVRRPLQRGSPGHVALNDIYMEASPEQVFAVLEDPHSYGDWVVGSKHIRDADPDWPALESKFHHTVGWGPLEVKDHTRVKELDRPNKLLLRAKTRPFGAAHVEMRLEPEGEGSRGTMGENPGG